MQKQYRSASQGDAYNAALHYSSAGYGSANTTQLRQPRPARPAPQAQDQKIIKPVASAQQLPPRRQGTLPLHSQNMLEGTQSSSHTTTMNHSSKGLPPINLLRKQGNQTMPTPKSHPHLKQQVVSDSEVLTPIQHQGQSHSKSRQQKYENHKSINQTDSKLYVNLLPKRGKNQPKIIESDLSADVLSQSKGHVRQVSNVSLSKQEERQLSQTQTQKNLHLAGVGHLQPLETGNQDDQISGMQRTTSMGNLSKSQKPIKVKVKCNFQFNLPGGQQQPTIGQLQGPVQALQEFFPSLPNLFRSQTPKKVTAIRAGLPIYKKTRNAEIMHQSNQVTVDYATDDVHDQDAIQIHPQAPAAEPIQQMYQIDVEQDQCLFVSQPTDPNLQINQSPIPERLEATSLQMIATLESPLTPQEAPGKIQIPIQNQYQHYQHQRQKSPSPTSVQHQTQTVFMPSNTGQMTMFDYQPNSQIDVSYQVQNNLTQETEHGFANLQDQLLAMNNYFSNTNLITRTAQPIPPTFAPTLSLTSQENFHHQNGQQDLKHQIQETTTVQCESILQEKQVSDKACSPIARSPRVSKNHKKAATPQTLESVTEVTVLPLPQRFTHDQQCMTSGRQNDTKNRGSSPIITAINKDRGCSPISKAIINDRGCSPITATGGRNDRGNSPMAVPQKVIHDRSTSPILISARGIVSKQDQKQRHASPQIVVPELKEQGSQTLEIEQPTEPARPILKSQSTQSSICQTQDQSTGTMYPSLVDQNTSTEIIEREHRENNGQKAIDSNDQKVAPTLLTKPVELAQNQYFTLADDVRQRSSVESLAKQSQKQKPIAKRGIFREDFINIPPTSEYNSVGASAITRITGSEHCRARLPPPSGTPINQAKVQSISLQEETKQNLSIQSKQSSKVAEIMKDTQTTFKPIEEQAAPPIPIPKPNKAKTAMKVLTNLLKIKSNVTTTLSKNESRLEVTSSQNVIVDESIQKTAKENELLVSEVHISDALGEEVPPVEASIQEEVVQAETSKYESPVQQLEQTAEQEQELDEICAKSVQREDDHKPEPSVHEVVSRQSKVPQSECEFGPSETQIKPVTKPAEEEQPAGDEQAIQQQQVSEVEAHQSEVELPRIHDVTHTTQSGMVSQHFQKGEVKYVDRSYTSQAHVHQEIEKSSYRAFSVKSKKRLDCIIQNLDFQDIEVAGKSPSVLQPEEAQAEAFADVEVEIEIEQPKEKCEVVMIEFSEVEVLPIEKSASLLREEKEAVQSAEIQIVEQDEPVDTPRKKSQKLTEMKSEATMKSAEYSAVDLVQQVRFSQGQEQMMKGEAEASYREVIVENDSPFKSVILPPSVDCSLIANSQIHTHPVQQTILLQTSLDASQAQTIKQQHKYGFPDAISSLENPLTAGEEALTPIEITKSAMVLEESAIATLHEEADEEQKTPSIMQEEKSPVQAIKFKTAMQTLSGLMKLKKSIVKEEVPPAEASKHDSSEQVERAEYMSVEETVHVIETEREVTRLSHAQLQFVMTLSNIPAPNTYANRVDLLHGSAEFAEFDEEVMDNIMDIQNDSRLHVSTCLSERNPPPPEKMSIVKDITIKDEILLCIENENESAEESEEQFEAIKRGQKILERMRSCEMDQMQNGSEPEEEVGILYLQKKRVQDRKGRKEQFRTLINAMHRPKKSAATPIISGNTSQASVTAGGIRRVRPMFQTSANADTKSLTMPKQI